MSAADVPRPNPYVGLVPYTEQDAAWFFGREREETIITANLRGSRLTLLYGASGVGKSSVLMAGVLPKLRALVRANRDMPAQVPAGRGVVADERAPFAIATLSGWSDPPLVSMMAAMREAAVEAAGGEAGIEPWSGEGSPVAAVRAWTRKVRMLLVILDQFEDYFLYHANEHGAVTFVEEFPHIVNDPELRVNVLISLREDAWPKLDRFKGRIPQLFGNYLRVPYLDHGAGRQAIRGPIDEYNRRLAAGEEPVVIAEPLVEAVLHEVRTGRLALGPVDAATVTSASGDRIETPFLQLVMERLWYAATDGGGRVLAPQTLKDLGGAEAIVSGHLAEAMDALSPDDQAIAAEVFHYLITPSKTKVAHDGADLAYWTNLPEADVVRVLEELASGSRRILRVVEPPAGEAPLTASYEIFHDVLGEAILDWRKRYEQEREKHELAARIEQEESQRRRAQDERHRERLNRLFRWLAVGLTALVLALVVAVVFALHERGVANEQREIARSRALASGAVAQLPVDPELSLLLSRAALADANTQAAVDALRRSLSASHVRAVVRGARARACGAACRPLLRADRGPPQSMRAGPVAFSPDGRLVAAISARGAWLWEPVTGRVRSLSANGPVAAVAFGSDGRSLVEVGRDDGVWLRSTATGRAAAISADKAYGAALSADGGYLAITGVNSVVVYRIANTRAPAATLPVPDGRAIAFSPDGRSVLVTRNDGDVILSRWRDGQTRPRRVARAAPPVSAAFSPDGRVAAIGGVDGRLRVVDLRTLETRFSTASGVVAAPTGAVFSPDSSRLLDFQDKDAALLGVDSGQRQSKLTGHADAISSAAFSSDGTLVATASLDGTIRVWDAGVGSLLIELRGHEAPVTGVAFSPDDRFVVSTSHDGTVRLWNVSTGPVLHHGDWVLDAAFSGDGRTVATAGADGVAQLWTPATGAVSDLSRQPSETLNSVAFGARGDRVLLGAERQDNGRGAVRLVDPRSARPLWVRSRRSGVLHVALSGDGRLALSVQRDGTADLWDPVTGASSPLRSTPRGGPLLDGEFSADGGRVILAGVDGYATVVDVRTRRRLVAYRGHRGGVVRAGALSPDGRWAATAGDRSVHVWDSRTGRVRTRLFGHTGPVGSVAFSPDGRRIVTGGSDGTTRVWDAATGHSVSVMQNHAAFVDSVQFSPDGRWILSSGDDRTAKVYPCDACSSLTRLRDLVAIRVTRALSSAERREFVNADSG
jgi:WD40 repeat protein